MRPVGHAEVVARLEQEVPAVMLFVGPSSVGKRTVARWALRTVVGEEDLLSLPRVGVDDVREVQRFLTFRPSVAKGVFFRLDEASERALNALLKMLEDPFENTYVAMSSVVRPIETIASRAVVFRASYLSDAEVAEVLQRQGYSEQESIQRARVANGRVRPALGNAQQEMVSVLAVLRSVQMDDPDLLLSTLLAKRQDGSDLFGDEQVWLLRTWAAERVSGRWRVFTASDAPGITREAALRVYDALAGKMRPRIAVKRALLPEMEAIGG